MSIIHFHFISKLSIRFDGDQQPEILGKDVSAKDLLEWAAEYPDMVHSYMHPHRESSVESATILGVVSDTPLYYSIGVVPGEGKAGFGFSCPLCGRPNLVVQVLHGNTVVCENCHGKFDAPDETEDISSKEPSP